MKTTHAILPALLLSVFALGGCSASAAPAEDLGTDDAELRRGWASGDCTRTIDVPINAQTLTSAAYGTVLFDWQGMATYTRLPFAPRLAWEIPPRDGDQCDASCVADVIARAAARGGKLHGTVRVNRFTDVRTERDGTCRAYHRETLALDLRAATKGLRPEWEPFYDFLMLESDSEVDVGPTKCPTK